MRSMTGIALLERFARTDGFAALVLLARACGVQAAQRLERLGTLDANSALVRRDQANFAKGKQGAADGFENQAE